MKKKDLVSILKVISMIVKDLRYTRETNNRTIASFQAGNNRGPPHETERANTNMEGSLE